MHKTFLRKAAYCIKNTSTSSVSHLAITSFHFHLRFGKSSIIIRTYTSATQLKFHRYTIAGPQKKYFTNLLQWILQLK